MNDGGPAYPQPFIYEPEKGQCGVCTSAFDAGYGGMSLLDYIAIHAPEAAIAAFMDKHGWNHFTMANHADARYRFAYAMIAEREKRLALRTQQA